jgi:NTE family protein
VILQRTTNHGLRTLFFMANKKIGLALGGGAARGFAHVGVLKALAEHNIPIDMIAGTSAGSVVGGAFAAGMTPDQIADLGRGVAWWKLSRPPLSPRGILSNSGLGELIARQFPVTRFQDLNIPFGAVACDIETGEEIVLKTNGDLAPAIRASCAIPGVFTPVEIDGRTLVDGGVVAPIPSRAVREMGADMVIAVDVIACGSVNWGKPTTLLGVMFQSVMMMLRAASMNQHTNADVVIVPQIGNIRPDELGRVDELIKAGEEAAREKIDKIKALIAG